MILSSFQKAAIFIFIGVPLTAFAEAPACAGDGVTDDTKCISGLFEANSLVELQAEATYRLTRPIVVRTGHRIQGHGATLLGSGSMESVLRIDGSNILIDSIRISTEISSNDPIAIDISAGAKHVSIKHSRFSGARSIAALNINAAGIEDITFDDNIVSDGVYGILANWRAVGLKQLRVTNNKMIGLSGDGVEINFPVLVPPHGTGNTASAPSEIQIIANKISAPGSQSISAGFCIGIAGAHDVVIRDNVLTRCRWQAIHLEDKASDISIFHNTVIGVISAQPGDGEKWKGFRDGILVLNSRRIRVRNNTISDIPDTGIDFTYDGKTFDAEDEICGNSLHSIGRFGISVMAALGQNVATEVGLTESCDANLIDAGEKLIRTNNPIGLVIGDPQRVEHLSGPKDP